MKCIITGLETNNKWKNFPICREAVELAKDMEGEETFLGCNMRERLIILGQRWGDRVAEEADIAMENTK